MPKKRHPVYLHAEWRKPAAGDGSLLFGVGLRQAFGDDGISRRVEGEPDMGTRHFEIVVWIPRHAIAPIDDAIVAGINCSLR